MVLPGSVWCVLRRERARFLPHVGCLAVLLLLASCGSVPDYCERAKFLPEPVALDESSVRYWLERSLELPTIEAKDGPLSAVSFFPDARGGPTLVWSHASFGVASVSVRTYKDGQWREAPEGPTWRFGHAAYASRDLGVTCDEEGGLHIFCEGDVEGCPAILHAVLRGEIWSPLEVVSQPDFGLTEILAATDSAGRVHVLYGGYITDEWYFTDWPHGTAVTKFLDQYFDGTTWSLPATVSPRGPYSQEAGQLVACPQGGMLLFQRMDTIEWGYGPTLLAVSVLDGATWLRPVVFWELPRGGILLPVRIWKAISPEGTAHVVWLAQGRVLYSARTGSVWTKPVSLDLGGSLVQIICDSRGRLVFLVRGLECFLVVRAPSGWSPPIPVPYTAGATAYLGGTLMLTTDADDRIWLVREIANRVTAVAYRLRTDEEAGAPASDH
jgi:hypothetical protein